MKIPKEIIGKNRIRDFDICRRYIDGQTPQEIRDERTPHLTLRRVQKIIYDNAKFINPRIGWHKSRRIHNLQRLAEANKDNAGRGKGYLDINAELRKEIEGDKPLIDNSKHEHFNVTVRVVDGDNSSQESSNRIGEFFKV